MCRVGVDYASACLLDVVAWFPSIQIPFQITSPVFPINNDISIIPLPERKNSISPLLSPHASLQTENQKIRTNKQQIKLPTQSTRTSKNTNASTAKIPARVRSSPKVNICVNVRALSPHQSITFPHSRRSGWSAGMEERQPRWDIGSLPGKPASLAPRLWHLADPRSMQEYRIAVPTVGVVSFSATCVVGVTFYSARWSKL